MWHHYEKMGKRKVQGVPRSQTAALPRTKRERKQTKPNKRKSNKRTKSTKTSSLSSPSEVLAMLKTEENPHKNKITQGKT